MKARTIRFSALLTCCAAMYTQADNPLVYDVGMADPHIFIFNDKAYMYTTRDDKEAATVFTRDVRELPDVPEADGRAGGGQNKA